MGSIWTVYSLFWFCVCVSVFQRGERATNLKDQIARWTFCLSDTLQGTMLTILAAGSVFFPGLFLLSKQCLKSIPALRWSEGDAVIVSARWDFIKLAFWFVFGLSCEHLVDTKILCGLQKILVLLMVLLSYCVLPIQSKAFQHISLWDCVSLCLLSTLCSQVGVVSSGSHGFFSWLHYCFFLRWHPRGPVSQEILIRIFFISCD